MILQMSHSTMITKVQEIVRGVELAIKIPEKYFDSLETALIEIADKIEKNQEVINRRKIGRKLDNFINNNNLREGDSNPQALGH